MAEKELNAFTKPVGSDERLPEESVAAKKAKEFRELQLSNKPVTDEQIERLGLPHPDTQTIHESQVSDAPSTKIILTNDTESLPKGAAGRILAEGVFEVLPTTASDTDEHRKSESKNRVVERPVEHRDVEDKNPPL